MKKVIKVTLSLTLALALMFNLAACEVVADLLGMGDLLDAFNIWGDSLSEEQLENSRRQLETFMLAQTFPCSPFYNEWDGSDLSGDLDEGHFTIQKNREATFIALTDELYAASLEVYPGEYQELRGAVLDFFNTMPALGSQERENALQSDFKEINATTIGSALSDEMELYSDMRQQTLEAAGIDGLDPYIASSLTYQSAAHSLVYAATVPEITLLLIAQGLYLIEAYPEGDTAALEAAIDRMDSHSDAVYALFEQSVEALGLLAETDEDNMIAAAGLLSEQIKESELFLQWLDDSGGSSGISEEDVELLKDMTALSIEIDSIVLELIRLELDGGGEAPAAIPQSFQSGVSEFEGGAAVNLADTSTVGTLAVYPASYDIQYRQVSSRFSMRAAFGSLKQVGAEIYAGAKFAVGVAGDLAGKGLHILTETHLSVNRFYGEAAIATGKLITRKINFSEYRGEMGKSLKQAGCGIVTKNSGVNFFPKVSDFFDYINPTHENYGGKNLPEPVNELWLGAHTGLRVFAGLGVAEDVVKMMSGKSTAEEREKIVTNFLTGKLIDGVAKLGNSLTVVTSLSSSSVDDALAAGNFIEKLIGKSAETMMDIVDRVEERSGKKQMNQLDRDLQIHRNDISKGIDYVASKLTSPLASRLCDPDPDPDPPQQQPPPTQPPDLDPPTPTRAGCFEPMPDGSIPPGIYKGRIGNANVYYWFLPDGNYIFHNDGASDSTPERLKEKLLDDLDLHRQMMNSNTPFWEEGQTLADGYYVKDGDSFVGQGRYVGGNNEPFTINLSPGGSLTFIYSNGVAQELECFTDGPEIDLSDFPPVPQSAPSTTPPQTSSSYPELIGRWQSVFATYGYVEFSVDAQGRDIIEWQLIGTVNARGPYEIRGNRIYITVESGAWAGASTNQVDRGFWHDGDTIWMINQYEQNSYKRVQ